MTWGKREGELKEITLHLGGSGEHDLTHAEWNLITRLARKRGQSPEHIAAILIRVGINSIITNTTGYKERFSPED